MTGQHALLLRRVPRLVLHLRLTLLELALLAQHQFPR
jgi:hypothetical protein